MRLAWFSPMPPVPSGVADYSADLVGALAPRHAIDVYVHAGAEPAGPPRQLGPVPIRSAHEFVWRQRLKPYDLTVYQVGNSSHHDYIWPYLFRYPGLAVLHDVRLHHARAAALLRTKRPADFRAEFAANQPDVRRDMAELAVAGFDNYLYYYWPMHKLIVDASRLTVAHGEGLAEQIREENPGRRVTSVQLGHGTPVSESDAGRARRAVFDRYGIDRRAIVFGVFGGLTPDKRLPQILAALEAITAWVPTAHLLLAGAPAGHYDVAAHVRARGLDERVTITGYLPDLDDLTQCIAACDVSLNLRWPTAGETSGPWLRALAAGKPTVTIDLAHRIDVPSLDPRTWRMNAGSGVRAAGSAGIGALSPRIPDLGSRTPIPITVAVDILDEDHSLRLAMRRLGTDEALRDALGHAGRRYWEREHSVPRMVTDYERVLAEAAAQPAPNPALPAHLVNNGDRLLEALLRECSVTGVLE